MSLKLLDVPMARYTDRTIEEMHKLIKKAKTDEKFRELALWLTRDGDRDRDWKNYIAELENAFNRLRKVVTYRRDPYQVEWVQNAWHTLRMKAGDCDDLSVLICSVMGATGAQYRFVTLKADRLTPTSRFRNLSGIGPVGSLKKSGTSQFTEEQGKTIWS
jgi:hypothetical protein